jgi:ATP-independent RNA helicase DbpA
MTQNLELAFSNLGLLPALSTNLVSLGYERLTPIQVLTLPHLLNQADLIAQSQTGSGKTVAFGLGILNHLNVKFFAVQALVLCPTRELAEQVSQALRQLARQMPNVKILNLSGGMPFTPQLDSLRHGAHIIVGTPGRVQKHLDKGSLSLKKLQTLILDEADRMLDMGFFEEIESIIHNCPTARQTLLFSATYPAEIKKLASKFMVDPQKITLDDASTLDIEQKFYKVSSPAHKFPVLK